MNYYGVPVDPEEDCGSRTYNGRRPPTCYRGLGCATCWDVYREVQGEFDEDAEAEASLQEEGTK